MNKPFIAATDAVSLSTYCANALRASGQLMSVLLADLPKTELDAIGVLLQGGGSVGIETLVDRSAVNRILLVGVEREGRRRVLAEVSASAPSGIH